MPLSFLSYWPFSPSSSSTFCFSCFTSWSKSCKKGKTRSILPNLFCHYFILQGLLTCIRVIVEISKTNADMRVFTHVLTVAVKKIPQGWTGTDVNTANITILKTDTTACGYQQPRKGRIWGPIWAHPLPCPRRPYTALHIVIVTWSIHLVSAAEKQRLC